MVAAGDDALVATDLGRLFIRNIARVFDAHTPERSERPTFSKTI
jgi:hypothetical protein